MHKGTAKLIEEFCIPDARGFVVLNGGLYVHKGFFNEKYCSVRKDGEVGFSLYMTIFDPGDDWYTCV